MLTELGHDGIGTAYTHRRVSAEAPTLLLIHGLGLTRDSWLPLIDCVEGANIVAYDLLGHGDSPPPPNELSLDDLADQAHGLLHELGAGPVHVIGHSMGALIALELALTHPTVISTLTCLSAVCSRHAASRAAVEARAAQIASAPEMSGVEETLTRWFGAEDKDDAPARRAAIRATLAANRPAEYGAVYGLFARADDAFANRLGELACPALFLTGADDPNSTPRMSREMAAEAPHAYAQIIDDARHMLPITHPETVATAIAELVNAQPDTGSSADMCIA
ncbi:MAG: alpha/beta hydrolase [Pseudomonadota bacterium]